MHKGPGMYVHVMGLGYVGNGIIIRSVVGRLCSTGPEEPVRLLRFWPDQYFRLQQYIFN